MPTVTVYPNCACCGASGSTTGGSSTGVDHCCTEIIGVNVVLSVVSACPYLNGFTKTLAYSLPPPPNDFPRWSWLGVDGQVTSAAMQCTNGVYIVDIAFTCPGDPFPSSATLSGRASSCSPFLLVLTGTVIGPCCAGNAITMTVSL